MQKVGNQVYGILNGFFLKILGMGSRSCRECQLYTLCVLFDFYLHFPGGFQCHTPLSLPLPVCTPDWNDKCLKKTSLHIKFHC